MDLTSFLTLPPLTLTQLMHRLVAVSVVIGLYGWMMTTLIEAFGDEGPRHDGRKTPNPLAHLDLIGFFHALFFRVPWLPRLAVDLSKIRGGAWGMLAATLIGSAGLAATSAGMLALRPILSSLLPGDATLVASALLNATADIALATAVIHLLPLPPLMGALWAPWGPRLANLWKSERMRWIGVVLLAFASLSGSLPALFSSLTQAWRRLLGF